MVIWLKARLILGYLLCFIAFFAPILGFIAPKGLAPLVIIGSIFCILIIRFQARKIRWAGLPIFMILLCLCLWALFSSLWSADPVSSIIGSAKLFGNIFSGWLLFVIIKSLSIEEAKLVQKFFSMGFFLAICIVVFEILLGGPIFSTLKGQGYYIDRVRIEQFSDISWLNSVMVVLSLFIWPVSIGLYKKKIGSSIKIYPFLIIISGFSTIIILSTVTSFYSGIVAIMCGLLASFIIFIFGRRAALLSILLTAAVSFVLPFGFNVSQSPISQINSVIDLPTSAEHRIGIWKFTSDKVLENPILGWGMNASKNIPGGKSYLFSEDGAQYGRALPLHPHNVLLQIWLELGLIGIVLFVTLCVFIIMISVNRLSLRFESAMMFGQFITILGISNLSFGMWQAWWLAAIWLSISFTSLVSSKLEDD